MKSIGDFIIFTDVVFNETFKTESGLELFADNRFSQKLLAQREVEIKAMPLEYEGEDIVGWQAFIDPTIYFQNLYNHGKGDNNEVAGYKGHFKVQPNMIIAIRKDSNSQWQGFEGNLIVEQVIDSQEEKKSGLIILDIPKSNPVKGVAKVVVPNEELDDVIVGDKIHFNDYYGVTVYLDNKELLWIRTKDCLAKIE
ncbi:MAG: co-chaperone GroES [Flavobacteriaceae bacterium]|jgi:co-chaperonin GroES (HSP10)|nr:co-chaperone GroES [Flavobacteriaceae bacterium]